jgi:hypothetical protein
MNTCIAINASGIINKPTNRQQQKNKYAKENHLSKSPIQPPSPTTPPVYHITAINPSDSAP